MDQKPWRGDTQELAGSADQIPSEPIHVGMTYYFRPIYSCSPSHFLAQIWDRKEEYVKLKTDLAEIYQERSSSLWIREEEAAQTMAPIAYVDSYNQTGKRYVIVHKTSSD